MLKVLLQIMTVCIFAITAVGYAQDTSPTCAEHPDGDPVDTPEPCEEECFNDEISPDENALESHLVIGHNHPLIELRDNARDRTVPESLAPNRLFRPPIG